MKSLGNMIALFCAILALPAILHASTENMPIPDELLEISCYNTQCSPETFSSIKKAYGSMDRCGGNLKGSQRLRVLFSNLIDFHFQNYLKSRGPFCKTGILPERKIIESTPWIFYIFLTFGLGIIFIMAFRWLKNLFGPPTR